MQLYGAAPLHLQGATLLMPAVAFANIGELAIDALVASLNLQRLAAADDPNVLPCVGNNPYTPEPAGSLATAMELYGTAGESPYFLLQQRAPVITGRQQHFAAAVASWAAAAGVSRVVLLAGLDGQYRREKQLEGSQLRWLTKGDQGGADACSSLDIQELEADSLETELEVHNLLPPWPLVTELEKAGVGVTVLSIWAAEGDNLPDARQLAVTALRLLKAQALDVSAAMGTGEGGEQYVLRTPCSWVGLYGA